MSGDGKFQKQSLQCFIKEIQRMLYLGYNWKISPIKLEILRHRKFVVYKHVTLKL